MTSDTLKLNSYIKRVTLILGKILGLNRKKVSKYLQEELGYKIRVIAGNHNKEEITRKYLEGEKLFISGLSINKITKQLKIHKKSFSNWLQEEKGHTGYPLEF